MLSRSLGLLFRFSRIQGCFFSYSARASALAHFRSAVPIVKIGFVLSLIAQILIGRRAALKIPVLSKAVIGTDSLIAMHNASTSNYINQVSRNCNGECAFKNENSHWDEIIVGSGPGGSVAAYYSIQSGRRTLVIEAGNYQRKNISHHSSEQLMESFAYGGQEVILSQDIIPFAQGRVVGGGSEVNSGLYHRLPLHIKNQWIKDLEISPEDWESEEFFVEDMLKIQKQSQVSLGLHDKSPLILAAQTQNWHCEVIPRWRTYSGDGMVHHGMESTFINQAKANGLIILPNHSVTNIFPHTDSVSIKIVGTNCSHHVKSKTLTLSAGTVETPKLLLRSKIIKANQIRMNFHAMSRLVAEYDYEVNNLHDIDPHQAWPSDYSVKFGAAVGTHELLAATLKSLQISENLELQNLGVYYASTVPSGKSGFLGSPARYTPYFILNKLSKRQIRTNVKTLHRGLVASGAKRVFGNLENPPISTVHIFGSLPLIGSSIVNRRGFVSATNGRVRVCDASLLPTAPIVNPQGPVTHLSGVLSKETYS